MKTAFSETRRGPFVGRELLQVAFFRDFVDRRGDHFDDTVQVGADVHIWLNVSRDSAGRPLVQNQDNGPGVAEHLSAEVFERFRRGESAPAGSGAGLGLAIVYSIAKIHRGNVRLLPPDQTSGAIF